MITTSRVGEQRLASIPKFLFWQDHTSSFVALAASDVEVPEVNLTEGPYRSVLKTARVSAGYFQVLGAELAIGRTFSAHEDAPGGPKAVVISAALWRRWSGSGRNSARREILLDNIAYKIVGVLAPGAHLETPADVWFPLCADRRSNDHIGRVRVIARLRPGLSLDDADKNVDATRIPYLWQYPSDSQLGAPVLYGEMFRAIPLRDAVVGDVKPALYMLSGAVAFLLAISCANTAALLLAKASRRTREMAVRLAAGAQRQQILSQLLTEAVLLSLGGGVGSLLLADLGVRALLAISPADLPRIGANGSAIALDGRVFAFTLIVSTLTGVLCGLIPALNASRTDINVLVKDSTSESGMTFRRNRWRSHLVIAEVALSLVLLAGAGLLIRAFVAKRAINRRFDERNVLTLNMSLSNPRFDETAQVAQLVRHAEQRLRTIPGVSAVATTAALPLASSLPMPFTIVNNDHSMVGRYDGTAAWRSVSAEYFKVFQIRLLRGRMFTDADDEHAAGVALINRAMARRYWQAIDANPIGDFITIGEGLGAGSTDTPRQIIGVVDDVREAGFDLEPSVYVPVGQISNWMNARNNRLRPIVWIVRTDGTQPAPAGRIQHELANASGGQPLGTPHHARSHRCIVCSHPLLLDPAHSFRNYRAGPYCFRPLWAHVFHGAATHRRTGHSQRAGSNPARRAADSSHTSLAVDSMGSHRRNPSGAGARPVDCRLSLWRSELGPALARAGRTTARPHRAVCCVRALRARQPPEPRYRASILSGSSAGRSHVGKRTNTTGVRYAMAALASSKRVASQLRSHSSWLGKYRRHNSKKNIFQYCKRTDRIFELCWCPKNQSAITCPRISLRISL